MNRRYNAGDYLQVIQKIRKSAPNTAITTDIIVGYPSESEADFTQTLELARKVGFAKIHAFRYSSRDRTPAAALKPLSPRIITRRAQILQEQAGKDALRYQESQVGRQVEAIIETVDKSTNRAIGTTREYLRVELPLKGRGENITGELKPGDLIQLPYATVPTELCTQA